MRRRCTRNVRLPQADRQGRQLVIDREDDIVAATPGVRGARLRK
jgi:hypothetical protein